MSSEKQHAERVVEIDQNAIVWHDRWRRLGNLKDSRKAGVVD
jgi:hypothetical protein